MGRARKPPVGKGGRAARRIVGCKLMQIIPVSVALWQDGTAKAEGNGRMLGIAVEKVCALIERVEAFDAGLEGVAETQGGVPDLDRLEALGNGLKNQDGPDPAHRELVGFIDSLNLDEQIALVALAWLGRGTYDRSEWDDALRDARDGHTEHTGDYLVGIPLLGTYLEEGLSQLGLSCD